MRLDAGRIDALIDGIYEAALSPDRWSTVLREVGQTIGATSGSALWFDGKRTTLLRGALWDVDPDAMAAYDQHYITICPRLRLSRLFGAGETYDDRGVRVHPSPTDREYYEYMDSIGCGLARTVLGERNAELRMGLTFYGPIRESDHDAEHRFLRKLAPHMGRAAHLTLRIADANDQASFGEQLFEMSPAMLLLNGQGRVQRTNSRADAVLALNDGLVLAQQHLHAANSSEDAQLQREIGAALEPRRVTLTGGFALVSRPSKQPAWAVSAIRLPASQRLDLPPRPQVLVTIVETVPRLSPAQLRQGFGLSQAEAEIAAALAGGMTLDQIAAARRASIETVRGQLKSIFAKLEVSTQAQLVGRIATVGQVVRAPSKR